VSLVLAPAGGASAADCAWDFPPQGISGPVNVVSPSVVTNGTTIVAVWTDFTNGDGIAAGEIQTAISTTGGNTWSTPLTISSADAVDPELAIDGANVSAIWATPSGLQVANSTDSGATWSTPVVISGVLPVTSGFTSFPAITRSGSSVTALWTADGVVQTASSTDGGVVWSAPTTLDGAGTETRLASAGAVRAATWVSTDQRTWAAVSQDAGATWGASTPVSAAAASTTTPQVAIAGSNISVMWADTTLAVTVIRAASSGNAGTTWSTPFALTAGGDADSPRLASDGTRVSAIWRHLDGVSWRTETAFSLDGGLTWSTATVISTPGSHSTEGQGYPLGGPEIVSDGTTYSATWSESTAALYQVVFASSSDGITWTAPVVLDAAGSGLQSAPRLTTDGSNVTVIWIDALRGISVTAYETTAACPTTTPAALAATGVSLELITSALMLLALGGVLVALRYRRTATSS
jgi:hypothetical protein